MAHAQHFPRLSTALRSGVSRAKAELRANGGLIGAFVLVLGAGLSLGLAAREMKQNPQPVVASVLPDAARSVQAMLQWKGPMAIGPAQSQQDSQRMARISEPFAQVSIRCALDWTTFVASTSVSPP